MINNVKNTSYAYFLFIYPLWWNSYCAVKVLKIAVLLFSVYPLPVQGLLHLHPTHMTDLSANLPQWILIFIKGVVRGVCLSTGFLGN